MWDARQLALDPTPLLETLKRRNKPIAFEPEALVRRINALRDTKQRQEVLNQQRNALAALGRAPTPAEVEAARASRAEASALAQQIEAESDYLDAILLELPNQLDPTVPDGADAADNVVIKSSGEPRSFDFEARDHVALTDGGGIDLERGSALSGRGFPVLRGEVARLNRALINFMLSSARQRGYSEVAVPFAVRRTAFKGTGQLPKFENDLFWVNDGELGLIPTAEVPLTNLVANEVLRPDALPLKLTAYSPCFRREAGGYGTDTRGILRVHQFEKVELVVIAGKLESNAAHEALTADAEAVLEALELPYQRVLLCAGDTGFSAQKTYDLEVWLPGQGRYREIASCTNCGAFQARRMNAKVAGPRGAELVHTLNGSGLAVGRTLIAILENHQQADGSVYIPPALRPFMDGAEVIDPRSAG